MISKKEIKDHLKKLKQIKHNLKTVKGTRLPKKFYNNGKSGSS